eukprot:14457-Heterococcus_DN1.PRE.2
MSCLPQVIQASQTSGSRVYRIPIWPVFFTQGIDIQQSVSNSTSSKTRGSFQADINANSFDKLNQYCTAFFSGDIIATPTSLTTPQNMLDSTCVITKSRGSVDGIAGDVKQLFGATNAAVKSSNSVAVSTHTHLLKLEAAITAQQHNQKNTAVLLESEKAVGLVGGGRVTFCKSGKDRTAMSVTLEEAFILVEKHLGASSSDTVGTTAKALRVANVLRAHGTRIAVAEKNIGYPQYSFNAIQRQFIPELYRAPLQTIQDVLTSFQKRDS